MDSRGVYRGPCTSCVCAAYTPGASGLKCTTCNHPPGKHQNLGSGGGVPAAVHSGTYSAGPISGHTYAHQAAGTYSNGQYQQYPQATYGGGTTTPHFQRQQSLPICKVVACNNSVHYEPGVGIFDYCSPECRDNDLLKRERDKLMDDLRQLEQDIRPHVSDPHFGAASTFGTTYAGKERDSKVTTTKKQATVIVCKQRGKDLGLQLHEGPFNASGTKGLLITGVITRSEAYRKIKSGDLRLLDVILKLNDQDVTDSLGKAFADKVREMTSLHMTVNRSMSIPCPSDLMCEVEKDTEAYIFALRNPRTTSQVGFGLSVILQSNQNLVIQGVTERTVARASGLKFNDIIVTYAQATEEKVEKLHHQPNDVQFDLDMQEAYRKGRSLILVVKRNKTTTL